MGSKVQVKYKIVHSCANGENLLSVAVHSFNVTFLYWGLCNGGCQSVSSFSSSFSSPLR